ncbi:hypothetical protein OB905_12495 [Halobacteria archaeon AArc-dxtr1]|nr:hypothetical protein [Halobacteria archaeon AArc-dxtr1]
MKRLIIHGDPGIRKGAIVDVDGEELVCFAVSRNGEWHGPEEVQLWCTVGDADEFEDFERQDYVPHFLDVERVDAADVGVVRAAGELTV